MQTKTQITFAALGVALVALLSAAEKDPELKKQLEGFKADFDQLAAQPEIKDLSAELQEARSDLSIYKEVIVDLKNQLEAALEKKEVASPLPVITIEKVKYQVVHGSHPHSAKEIAESPELAKEIMKIKGQNAIVKL